MTACVSTSCCNWLTGLGWFHRNSFSLHQTLLFFGCLDYFFLVELNLCFLSATQYPTSAALLNKPSFILISMQSSFYFFLPFLFPFVHCYHLRLSRVSPLLPANVQTYPLPPFPSPILSPCPIPPFPPFSHSHDRHFVFLRSHLRPSFFFPIVPLNPFSNATLHPLRALSPYKLNHFALCFYLLSLSYLFFLLLCTVAVDAV